MVHIEACAALDGGVVVPGVPGARPRGDGVPPRHLGSGHRLLQQDLGTCATAVVIVVPPPSVGGLAVVAGAVLGRDRQCGDCLVQVDALLTVRMNGCMGGGGEGQGCEQQRTV